MRVSAGLRCAIVLMAWLVPSSALAGDSPLPWGKKAVPEHYRGDLSLPCGISFGYTRMTDTVAITDFSLALGGQPLPPGAVNVTQADHATNTFMARVDAWILPFVNVYAFAATLDGRATNIALKVTPIPGVPALPIPSKIEPEYNGHLYGIGTTLAGGYKKFFAAYDINREWVTLNMFSNTAPALVQSVRAGLRTRVRGNLAAVYVGGFHLSLRDAVLSGSGIFPGVPNATFSMKARPVNAWNTLVGASIEVTRKLVITAEAGLGTRKQFTIMPGVRF